MKTPNDFGIEENDMDSKEYVSVDDLVKYTGISRQTIIKRLDVFPKFKPGPGGSRLYPTEIALYVVSDGEERPYRLTSKDALVVQVDLLRHRLRELEAIVAPITSVARLKKEIRMFVRETSEEQRAIGVAINTKFRT